MVELGWEAADSCQGADLLNPNPNISHLDRFHRLVGLIICLACPRYVHYSVTLID
jgi:hypothetical protein